MIDPVGAAIGRPRASNARPYNNSISTHTGRKA